MWGAMLLCSCPSILQYLMMLAASSPVRIVSETRAIARISLNQTVSLQWVSNGENFDYAHFRFVKASLNCWRGIIEPWQNSRGTSVNGDHPIADL